VVQGGDQPGPQSAPALRPLAAPERLAAPVAISPPAVISSPAASSGAALARSSVPPAVPPKAVQAAPVAVPQASTLSAVAALATEKRGLAAAALPTAKPMPTAPARKMLSEDFEELLVHRVMQRVDVSLDLRLRDAIASVVLEQTRSILPRLREEVESVVRHAVYEAVADELASKSNQ
jgi:hypothetical protein